MAFCYDLISCDLTSHPSKFGLKSAISVLYSGAIVNISGFTQVYTLVYLGIDVCTGGILPTLIHHELEEACPNVPLTCVTERTLSFANFIIIPPSTPANRGFKECCYDNVVLADNGSSDYEKNDFVSFYFVRQTASDDIIWKLTNPLGGTFTISDDTYGSFKDFGSYPDQPNLKTFKIEWEKVLTLLGEFNYNLSSSFTVGGIALTSDSNTFHLKQFTTLLADKTVRIDSVMNGELVHLGIDFKGTDYTTSLRMMGFFGRRNTKFVQDNIVKRDYSVEQISMSQENEYQFQTGLLPICITDELYDFILFGNEIFISDYNLNNHSYGFTKFAVELDSNKGANYYSLIRDSRVNLIFKDRIKNKRKINC